MCNCPTNALVTAKPPDPRSVDYDVVDKLPEGCNKACFDPKSGKIQVDRKYWNGFTPAQRQAALAHEMAHKSGADCEPCADFVAGGILRRWGHSKSSAESAMGGVVRNRSGGAMHAGSGWSAAGATPGAHSLDTFTSRTKLPSLAPKRPAVGVPGKQQRGKDATMPAPSVTNPNRDPRGTPTKVPSGGTTPATTNPTVPGDTSQGTPPIGGGGGSPESDSGGASDPLSSSSVGGEVIALVIAAVIAAVILGSKSA